ncbi:MAG TPA: transcription antitermination factor NusB [Candidatus Deferrimicrobiaceae bacterium]|nr:transcription antitermination factor NusB [Candidatus Deferrimicrobiaceae bacterium]
MRRESREKVFQTLFMMDFLGVGPEEAIPLFPLVAAPARDGKYYEETVRAVWEHREEIDALIRQAAEHWRLERMTIVDRNILRLGAFEIGWSRDIPFVVAINEAVDLGKRFGSEESGAFINGILDRISEITRKKVVP